MNILIVDDIATSRKLLRAVLEAEGLTVIDAADGVEALTLLEREPVDAVISDILMPRMDGYRLCYELRKSERFERMPIIIYSSTYTSPADEKLSHDVGADKYLKKPAPVAEIMDALHEVTQGAGRPRTLATPLESLDETTVMKEYNEALIRKLEEKNADLQRSTEELHATQAKLNYLLAQSPTVLYSLRVEGRTVARSSISENIERITGFTVEESLRPNWWLEHLHPDERERVLTGQPAMLSQDETSDEYRFQRKDGSYVWVLDDRRLLRDAQGQPVQIIGSWTDISERKQAEEALRASEEYARNIIRSSLDMIVAVDRERKITEFNEAAQRTFGYTPEEVLGQSVDLLYANPEEGLFVHKTTVEKGRCVQEIQNRRKNGKVFTSLLSSSPLRDLQGEFVGVMGVSRDITDVKQAEETLRQAEEKYRNIFQNVVEGIFQTTPDGRYLTVNPALARMYGCESPEDLIAATTDIARQLYVDPNRRAEFKQALEQNDAVLNFEAQVYRKDGSIIWISENARAVRDESGRVLRYEGTTQDITDRKRAEEALRRSEERYRTLVELSPDAICIRSQDKLVLANPAAVALFGAANANELQGRNFLEFVHPDSRALVEERMRKLRETNATQPAVDERLLRLDKSSFDAEVIAAPFVFQGQPSALVIVRDVTEKKSIHQKLLRNQRLESLGTLSGGIAHDLNNVLAPILLSIDLLQLKVKDEESRKILSTIGSSAQRGADLVKQVLTFSRGLQGERMPVQIRHVMREMQAIIRQTFPKSISLQIEMPQNLWTVTGDDTQLHQVLMNLCVNARDAMPHGGTLRLKSENLMVDEAFARMNPEAHVGPYVVLTVTDTGTGMPPEIRDRIFEPFFSTKEQGKGTGLGLSTVRGIAKRHGGFVNVYSEVGRGSRFKVYLPAEPSAETQRAESERLPLPTGHGEMILVVDDEKAIQQIAQQTLQMCGYSVLTANDGAEATAVCAQHVADLELVITDMMMPVMDGPATVRAIRVVAPNVKIIAASGLGSEARETDPEKLGVNAFLRKPFTAETLVRTVGETLRM